MSNDVRAESGSDCFSEQGSPCAIERGRLIVVCAPSGAGKSSLVEMALARIERVKFSVSYTTRKPRGAERDGVNYFFVSHEEFRALSERDEFLESAEVHGNLYGTHRAHVEEMLAAGFDVLLDIDVQGAEQIRRRTNEAVTIFILPPSRDALERRLLLRNLNNREEIERRLHNAAHEVLLWDKFDYLIINDDLDRAYRQLEAIIIAERCRPGRQAGQVRVVLDTFGGESIDA
ncbi:MAG TPA: guanylate kinase [Blastocatellia bacterium]|nr:guanylate kinase [Blastocatellia bacterium]